MDTVRNVEDDTCDDPETGDEASCRVVCAGVTSGDDEGRCRRVRVLATQFDVPDLASGDSIVLLDVADPPAAYRYSFASVRAEPLWWLLAGSSWWSSPSAGGRACGR